MAFYDVFLLVFAALFLILIFYFQYAFAYCKKRGIPTIPPTFPFGNVKSAVFREQSMNDIIMKVYNTLKSKGCKFGAVYCCSIPVFIPIDIELIRNILVKDFNYFDDRGIYFDEENDPVSAHLFSLYGEKWKKLRSKLSPAFTAGKIKYMFNAIHKCGNDMIEVLNELIQIDNKVEIKDISARFSTDVIGSCAFGIDCDSLKNPEAEFRKMGNKAFKQNVRDLIRQSITRVSPTLAKLLKLSIFPADVSIFFKNVVEDTMSYREKHQVMRNDFLQLLIRLMKGENLEENSNEKLIGENCVTKNEAIAQAFIFFLAGFETTSTSLGFTILELAIHQDVQDRARKEVLKSLENFSGEITHDAIADLPYMEMILLESLRKYPPAPGYMRRCTKDYKIPGTDVIIPENMGLVIPTMAVQRDPEFYPNPEVFDPERFSKENRGLTKESAYLPFGAGPRKCVGMRFAMVQSKLALSLLLKNFTFTLSPKTTLPLKMVTSGIVLAPMHGIWIQLEKRQ